MENRPGHYRPDKEQSKPAEQPKTQQESARNNPLAPHNQEHQGSKLSPAEQADPANTPEITEWLRELPQRLTPRIWEATWKRAVEEEFRKTNWEKMQRQI